MKLKQFLEIMHMSSKEELDEFDKVERFECSCGNWQDFIAVTYSRMDWGPNHGDHRLTDDLSLHVQMNHFLPWYKRLVRAILYVFAKDAKWSHWSETLISHKDAIRLKKILEEYIDSPHTDKSK